MQDVLHILCRVTSLRQDNLEFLQIGNGIEIDGRLLGAKAAIEIGSQG